MAKHVVKDGGETRQVDSKGRLTLDKRFAGRSVIVRMVDATEVVVTLARVIPEREAWLYENPKAKKAVLTGLEEARRKEFAEPPDLAADGKLARKMGNDDE